jgi:hypothetical protein
MKEKILDIIENKKFHITVIVIGMLFTCIPLFHGSLWFDESYSVAMASRSFAEIWSIDIFDVHPPLYYMLLHCIYLCFGENIIIYRLFSWICLSFLGIFGYTKIRVEYGSKCGLLFSFLVFFLPSMNTNAGEIRMYSLVFLLVSEAAFYARKIAEGRNSDRDIMKFSVFCIAAAYTHYYGLLASAVMNLLIFAVLLKNHHSILKQIIAGTVEIICYVPWLIPFANQASSVSSNFWITFQFPQTLLQMFSFQFSGNLETVSYINDIAVYTASISCILLLIIGIRKTHQNKTDIAYSSLFSIGVYLFVLLAAAAGSLVLHRMIIYPRYLLVCTGLLILFAAVKISEINSKRIVCSILCIILACSFFEEYSLCRINYDASNNAAFTYLQKNLRNGDTILISNADQDPTSFVFMHMLKGYSVIYLNECGWNESSIKAYGAFGKMKIINTANELSSFKGRVWVAYGDDNGYGKAQTHTANELKKAINGSCVSTEYFKTSYKNQEFTVSLVAN